MNANFAANEATENSKGQKKKLMLPSYSSSLEISDDIWEEESIDDETNITSIPSSVSKNKKRSNALRESSPKQKSIIIPQLNYERLIIKSTLSNLEPPTNQHNHRGCLKAESKEHSKHATNLEVTGNETDLSSLVFSTTQREKIFLQVSRKKCIQIKLMPALVC